MPLLTDPSAVAGLVTREVRTGHRDDTPTRIAVARRSYATDREDLWEALTDAERIPRWFLPISGELRLGGRYQTEGNAGGVIDVCRRPETFAVTWEIWDQRSWVTVTLTPAAEGTVLELTHEMPVDPEFWGRFGPGAVGVGWDIPLMALGLYTSRGEPVDPDAGRAFPLTPEGRVFVRVAATGWADAAAADGDDPAAAHAAGERTMAFYTTAPEDDTPQHE